MNSSTFAPLTKNTLILDRAIDQIGTASRRQLWLMFLDSQDAPFPVLLPTEIPACPGQHDAGPFSTFIAEVAKAVKCSAIVAVLERPGTGDLTEDDLAWFGLLNDSIALAGAELRATLLCSSEGVEAVST